MTDDFLKFAWQSLTIGQQDLITVKYHIASSDKPLKELAEEIEGLKLNEKYIRSIARIRKIRKYEIQLILDKLDDNINIS